MLHGIIRTGSAAAVGAALLCAGPAVAAKGKGGHNRLPSFISGEVIETHYDGISDDLLTAGLGRSGLAGAAPTFDDPLAPTAAELRRLAIYVNYRALVDTAPGGGYGELYGPNVTADGTVTAGEGLIAGTEVIAYAGGARRNVTLMVQVPDSFDPANACIVTAPSSGSRGVYGAIGTAGEWGLKNGCAVAYTDKGTGTGAHNLSEDTVGLIDGTRADAEAAGDASSFTARARARQLAAYNAAFPDRWAFKHAHSEVNPERDWGKNVLQSVEFAFYVLNELYGDANSNGGKKGKAKKTLHPSNTIVIASSVSNGGGASVRAAEQDRHGLIDGVAVSEPNVNPRYSRRFAIVQGDGPPLFDHSRDLYDYTTLLNVYQGCASADPAAADDLGPAPFNFAASPAACQSLRDKGLLGADDPAAQAAEAQAILNEAGFLEEQNVLMPSHWTFNVPQAIAVTYANAYSRSSVLDNLCDYSFGATDATGPVPLAPPSEAALFSNSNGIPPTAGVNLINNAANLENRMSTPDQNLDGALCLRSLAEGRDAVSGKRLRGRDRALSRHTRNGIRRILASGRLRGTPAIFVTGRSDAILPPNHTSRAYFGLNRVVDGRRSRLTYVEVLNAHHLDALNGFPGFSERYVPLHHYFNQALDRMLAHLRDGAPLPPSQVVRTTRRGAGSPPLTAAHVPDIADAPATGDAITFEAGEVRIPD